MGAVEMPGSKSKYFATFPYPYMNGLLHLGHAFSLTKAEFAVGYQRMQGKQCLWPFAFHCTGMPIQAAADTLKRELVHAESPGEEVPLTGTEATGVGGGPSESEADAGAARYQSGKSKVASKRGNAKTQAEVLLSMGVPGEEIKEFCNAEKWLSYFPLLAREDLKAMGLKIDWRRTFITTEASPWYDAFVRWQFRKLKELEKVKFGKRLSIFSPRDQQICADHDRAVGEGVCPQEYTLIKMRLMSSIPALSAVQELRNATVYLLAATLRPETMYGQTNCWVLPHDKEGNDVYYGCYRTHIPGEIVVVSEQAAVNMAYQSLSPSFGKAELVCRVKGADLLGLEVAAPLSQLKVVRTLPLLTISMGKGTGIVTCVPGDAPDDYAALADLQRKAPLRDKYKIEGSWVVDLAPIPVIESVYKHDVDAPNATAVTTRCVAEEACKEYKVASQNDRAQLALAKEKAYKLGFYEGTMVVGHLTGVKVEQAKALIRDKMVEEGDAYIYAEPEREVTSRSGDKCVVALTDQWYLTYGETLWQAQVAQHLNSTCEMYSADTRSRFAQALDWLKEWACSRQFGLGSRLPFDETQMIESLSDSTLYMAFYTICHLLPGASTLTPSSSADATQQARAVTDDEWDFIFLGRGLPAAGSGGSSGVFAADELQLMRREFAYWYPVDLRVSGRDLIQNHLLFFLYVHAAMLPRQLWPRAIRTNGHVVINNAKMSKSTGNFLTLRQAIQEYSADGMRFALAQAGDSNEDANFEHDVANAAILKLSTELQLVEKLMPLLADDSSQLRAGPADEHLLDRLFSNDISRCVAGAAAAHEAHQFRDALIWSFDLLQHCRDRYRCLMGSNNQHKLLLRLYITTQTLLMAPFCPHYSEHVWAQLGNSQSIMRAPWPRVASENGLLSRISHYLDKTLSDVRVLHEKARKNNKGVVPVGRLVIFVARDYLDWQAATLAILADAAACATQLDKHFKKSLLSHVQLTPFTQHNPLAKRGLLPFAQFKIDDFKLRGLEALELSLPFDEAEVLNACHSSLQADLVLDSLEVVPWPPSDELKASHPLLGKLAPPTPGHPACLFS